MSRKFRQAWMHHPTFPNGTVFDHVLEELKTVRDYDEHLIEQSLIQSFVNFDRYLRDVFDDTKAANEKDNKTDKPTEIKFTSGCTEAF